MKSRLLLLALLLWVGIIRAQEPIRTLIITEARLDRADESYLELTNVGTDPLDLSKFEVGVVGPWTTVGDSASRYSPQPALNNWTMLPNKILAPGKSFVIANVSDYNYTMWLRNPERYNEFFTKREFNTLADMALNIAEAEKQPNALDKVDDLSSMLTVWGGREGFYVRYHFPAKEDGTKGDSVIVDEVNLNRDNGGRNYDRPYAVAGVSRATNTCTLIRRFNVTSGNPDFPTGRGVDLTDSEWMPIPYQIGSWDKGARLFWTAGNHVDAKVDENTLKSTTLTVDWANLKISVPRWVRRDDSIMYQFNQVPGIAWHYKYVANVADSGYVGVRTGDKLVIYGCGNSLDIKEFEIVVASAAADDNKVVPKRVPTLTGVKGKIGFYQAGSVGNPGFCRVSDNKNGNDSITRLAYATRVDSLKKYLDKADNAKWEIVWVDGTPRTYIQTGDILKVTAENGSVREYTLKTLKKMSSHNATLSAITWPDIPEDFVGYYEWSELKGDTIPGFVPTRLSYTVIIPADSKDVPQFVAKAADPRAKVVISRPKNLTGSNTDRTLTYTVTAEDDTTINVYSIELVKAPNMADLQVWQGEPFISQIVFRQGWSVNNYVEIANPGNVALDLSHYMIAWLYSSTPEGAITSASKYAERWIKYIPGKRWVNEEKWAVTPSLVEDDGAVNYIVQPGNVFVLANIANTTPAGANIDKYLKEIDVDFVKNPWGESIVNYNADGSFKQGNNCAETWWGGSMYLFKITNDSVYNGLKPANNANDFELLDVFAPVSGGRWKVAGIDGDQRMTWIRKAKYYQGNPVIGASAGTNEDDAEWLVRGESYFNQLGVGWPNNVNMCAEGIGSHLMDEVTHYSSKVISPLYRVSTGYSLSESIDFVQNNTSVDAFLANITKKNVDQVLTVKSHTSDVVISGATQVATGDSLVVVSADGTNTTKYIITISVPSTDVTITSSQYDVNLSGAEGTIGSFAYGTTLKNFVENINIPETATASIINAAGFYVPLNTRAFDSIYVDTKVSSNMFIEVIAEDQTTKAVYQLKPTALSSDAFVTSNMYLVDEANKIIKNVPLVIDLAGFQNYIDPVTGASYKVVDYLGAERKLGTNIAPDDKVVVTSQDGTVTNTYWIQLLGLPEVIFHTNVQPSPASTSTIRVYPNPTAGDVHILGAKAGNSIEVYSLLGTLIQSQTAKGDFETVNIQAKAGLYIVVVKSNGTVVGQQKVVVK